MRMDIQWLSCAMSATFRRTAGCPSKPSAFRRENTATSIHKAHKKSDIWPMDERCQRTYAKAYAMPMDIPMSMDIRRVQCQ